METIILNNYKEFFGLMLLIYFFPKISSIIKEIKTLLVNWLNLDLDRRKKKLLEDLNYVKEKDSFLEGVLKYEIENIIHSDITGYNWKREKQIIFLEFYNKIKNEISLKDFKFLFKNCNINNDNIVSIKIVNSTKTDQIFKYLMSIMMLILTILLLIMSFKINSEPLHKQLIISFLFMISFLTGTFLLIEAIRIRKFIKTIKEKYDDYEL